jgi:DNA-binding transcriptional LysR family regulator
MADPTPAGLRVLVAVSERGSFTAAASALGYTQSAVSRQVATLETAVGQRLFDRHRGGVSLTAAGGRLLPRAVRIVADLDAALSEVASGASGRVRFGTFPMAAAGVLPAVLAALAEDHPDVVVTVRESSTAGLVRSVRAGTLDAALVAQAPPYRPPDAESPALEVATLLERDLVVAVGTGHPLARRRAVEVEELEGRVWVAGPADDDTQLGVWPGLRERTDVRYVARDWLTKLRLVAAGLALTTVSPSLSGVLPDGVRLLQVRGEPRESRRLSLVRIPGPVAPELAVFLEALRAIQPSGRGGGTGRQTQ